MASNPFLSTGVFGGKSAASQTSQRDAPPNPFAQINPNLAGQTNGSGGGGSGTNNPFVQGSSNPNLLNSSSPVGSSAGLPPTQPGVVGTPWWTDYTNYFLNENPEVAGSGYLTQQGINPYSAQGRYLAGTIPQQYQQYQQLLTQQPGLNFSEALKQSMADAGNMFATMQQRLAGPTQPRRIL